MPTSATFLSGSVSTQEEAQAIIKKALDKAGNAEDIWTVEDILREKGFTKKWGGEEIIDVPKVAKLTGLSPGIFRTNMWKSDCVVDMALVISMAIGLKLSPIMTNRLLQSAGLAFRLDNPEHIAYIFLLEYCRNMSIPECNKILDGLGIRKTRQLGSHQRGKNGEYEGYKKDDN